MDEIIKSDPEFAAKLKRLLDRYNQEEQKHVISAKYESDLSGTGSIAQGEGSTSVTATEHGIAIGSVQGDLKLNRND